MKCHYVSIVRVVDHGIAKIDIITQKIVMISNLITIRYLISKKEDKENYEQRGRD